MSEIMSIIHVHSIIIQYNFFWRVLVKIYKRKSTHTKSYTLNDKNVLLKNGMKNSGKGC